MAEGAGGAGMEHTERINVERNACLTRVLCPVFHDIVRDVELILGNGPRSET